MNEALYMSTKAMAKMFVYVDNAPKDCEINGIGRFEEDQFGVPYVDDVIILPQEVTAVTAEIKSKVIDDFLNGLEPDERKKWKFQWHSHVEMGCAPSGTDLDDWAGYSEFLGNFVAMIVNKRREYTAFHYSNWPVFGHYGIKAVWPIEMKRHLKSMKPMASLERPFGHLIYMVQNILKQEVLTEEEITALKAEIKEKVKHTHVNTYATAFKNTWSQTQAGGYGNYLGGKYGYDDEEEYYYSQKYNKSIIYEDDTELDDELFTEGQMKQLEAHAYQLGMVKVDDPHEDYFVDTDQNEYTYEEIAELLWGANWMEEMEPAKPAEPPKKAALPSSGHVLSINRFGELALPDTLGEESEQAYRKLTPEQQRSLGDMAAAYGLKWSYVARGWVEGPANKPKRIWTHRQVTEMAKRWLVRLEELEKLEKKTPPTQPKVIIKEETKPKAQQKAVVTS